MDIKQALKGLELDLREIKTRLPGQTEPAWFKPLTLQVSDRIARQVNMLDHPTDGDKLVITVVTCVLDKDGKPVFDKGDKQFLHSRVPQDILIDIVNEIGENSSLEDAEGN